MANPAIQTRLSLIGMTKAFPGILALDTVDFHVAAGEVHALLGENGAGKSTLLNILSGVRPADSGKIMLDGQPLEINNPLAARKAGIAMIHQELQHVPEMTVAQNLFLGRPKKICGGLFVASRAQELSAKEIIADLDPSIDPSAPIKSLRVAQRQIVEIAKALLDDAKLIAMDEPTSSLTPSEFDRLAELIASLSKRGVSIIYVSHKMDEVFQVCTSATILRDGKMVAVVNLADETETSVVSKMVGREVTHTAHKTYATENKLLSIKDLGRDNVIKKTSFDLHQGEVLGISGLVGAGRSELLRLIAGVDKATSGTINVKGANVSIKDPRNSIRAGIGLVPEERKREGIIHARSIASNLALPSMRTFTKLGLLQHRRLFKKSHEEMTVLGLRPLNIHQPIGTFSGGNQQKAIIGRWLIASTEIFLFDEPTRGIDVGAKSEIYALIELLASEGKAIIVVSSEMPEIIRLCDRVLVMREGEITASLKGDEISEQNIAHYAIAQSNNPTTINQH